MRWKCYKRKLPKEMKVFENIVLTDVALNIVLFTTINNSLKEEKKDQLNIK